MDEFAIPADAPTDPYAGQSSRLLAKKSLAQMLDVSTRHIERLDSNKGPDRSFPRPVWAGAQKRWWHHEIVAWINSTR